MPRRPHDRYVAIEANIADLHVSVGDVVEALEGGRAFRPESRTHCSRQMIALG
jgi:hypothetical protein